MKIALLTMFNGFDATYSLINVVYEQLEMFLNHDIEVSVLVSESCDLDSRYGIFLDPRIQWVPIVNQLNNKPIKWYDYTDPTAKLHTTFAEEVQVIATDFVKTLADIDLCIMHDILYQGWHYVHNLAIRVAQKSLPHLRFISFTHSFPAKRPSTISPGMQARFMEMPRTLFAYPTDSGLPALAKQYNISEGRCRTVYNSLSLLSFLVPEVSALQRTFNLLDTQLLVVYPCRLTPSKKLEKVVALAGSIYTTTNKSIKVVFCDFKSLDIDEHTYKSLIREEAKKYGLPDSCLCFTSECGFADGFPRQAVLDLFTLSNLFICPSFSESFGLTVLEAASRGNYLVLNKNVPALEELGTKLHTYFLKWDARGLNYDLHESYFPSEQDYYKEHAHAIVSDIYSNSILYAKTQVRYAYTGEWIWHHQLEPLIYSALALD